MKEQTVIVSGGAIEESFALAVLKNKRTTCVIGVDKGLFFLHRQRIKVDYIVGDFDSISPEIITYYRKRKVPVFQHRTEKNCSDTELAIRFCVNHGKKNIRILGATGSRLDHMLGNIQSLRIATEKGFDAQILDAHNRIRLLNKSWKLKKEEAFGSFFSVFPLGEDRIPITIRGAKYPLTNHILTANNSLCVSNEFAAEEIEILLLWGMVIFVESRD